MNGDQKNPKYSWSGIEYREDSVLPIGECAFHLNFVEETGHARKHMAATEQGFPVLHQLSNGVAPIANELLELRRDESDGLCLVQLQTACQAFLGQETCLK